MSQEMNKSVPLANGLYPIVRRVRRPLMPAEAPVKAAGKAEPGQQAMAQGEAKQKGLRDEISGH